MQEFACPVACRRSLISAACCCVCRRVRHAPDCIFSRPHLHAALEGLMVCENRAPCTAMSLVWCPVSLAFMCAQLWLCPPQDALPKTCWSAWAPGWAAQLKLIPARSRLASHAQAGLLFHQCQGLACPMMYVASCREACQAMQCAHHCRNTHAHHCTQRSLPTSLLPVRPPARPDPASASLQQHRLLTMHTDSSHPRPLSAPAARSRLSPPPHAPAPHTAAAAAASTTRGLYLPLPTCSATQRRAQAS